MNGEHRKDVDKGGLVSSRKEREGGDKSELVELAELNTVNRLGRQTGPMDAERSKVSNCSLFELVRHQNREIKLHVSIASCSNRLTATVNDQLSGKAPVPLRTMTTDHSRATALFGTFSGTNKSTDNFSQTNCAAFVGSSNAGALQASSS